MANALKDYYEADSSRFWDPTKGMGGRDLDVYPMFNGLSGNLIEYGFGAGSLLLNLATESRFRYCVGIDISEVAIKKANDAWLRMATGDCPTDKLMFQMPTTEDTLPNIPDSYFDVLVSVATIEHVLNPYTVLDELYRVAKPTGKLICSVPNYAYLKHRIHLLLGIQPRTGTDAPVANWRTEGWDGMHLHTFTKSSFTTLLKDCGWTPTRWTGCGTRFNKIGLGYFRKKYPGLMSGELIAYCERI